jgi:hypothetical protein
MSSATLLDAVRRAADEPSDGFTKRRKGMPEATAQAIVDVVIDEVLRVVTPRVEREWSGNFVLAEVRALKGSGNGPVSAVMAPGRVWGGGRDP